MLIGPDTGLKASGIVVLAHHAAHYDLERPRGPMADEEHQKEVTRLIQAAGAPDRAAADRLLALVYDQLRKIAQQRLRAERSGATLQATALVHEAYLRLVGDANVRW